MNTKTMKILTLLVTILLTIMNQIMAGTLVLDVEKN